ncbi:hypothetical protein NCER_100147 [Vairimorpha ceranae BRL01]|uniref:BZIP domain-containing protein n=2 Tax=Vairimorpha ceranae TaxID=40302 RepID=C4V6V1_VAIC1|nr:leucine zipper domain-containing protein [Vairimorpha ceranae]EEQ83059.1 hypothetical protein NCER_100147 [Vairimorpha ceranae BRL01]KAF5140240.1 hypothetical protein G9O61_00g016270 [Vairimorpha ceranae]KKO75090.1 leucine zipper domain-containing protein [Vairimorpha ceranae]
MKDHQNTNKKFNVPDQYDNNYYYQERMEPPYGRYPIPNEYMHPVRMNEYLDEEQLKIIWKKEKNRLAAKKSREKKLTHIKDLEKKEYRMGLEINDLKEAIEDYDRILKNIFDYIKHCIGRKDKKQENLVYLFDCLCRLKKQNGEQSFFLKDINYMFENKLTVKNEDIEDLTDNLRESLNEIFERK